jgi:DNA (cytosine-5)-methyltransferase 1
MNHIELFAGCGGLCLGLETAGFDLIMANELSPMASETFARNILNADLTEQSNIAKVLWLSSSHQRKDIQNRFRENPMTAVGLKNEHHSDIEGKQLANKELDRSLLIGSITDLNKILENDKIGLLKQLKSGLGRGGVDLVSGGPPCQSFSMAGLRDHRNQRNALPWEFAKFVGMVQPKIALLENVSGILRAFDIDGKKHYAWHEVAKAFAKVGYVPLCLHVNAKYAGAAQNRPRFILIALRMDIYNQLGQRIPEEPLLKALQPAKLFVDRVQRGEDPELGAITCFDIEKNHSLFTSGPLAALVTHNKDQLVSVEAAIDDLRSPDVSQSSYVQNINQSFCNFHSFELNKVVNHEFRANGPKVRARFRLNQVLNKLDTTNSRKLKNYIKYADGAQLDRSLLKEVAKHWLVDINGTILKKGTQKQIASLLEVLRTHKHSQRALKANRPAPAVLGSPDDTSHYYESESTQRTLTVRELARIQSFPDWYEFKSKVTTGGQSRKFEVPQYTQVGNAVPPLLGRSLGRVCAKLLETCE